MSGGDVENSLKYKVVFEMVNEAVADSEMGSQLEELQRHIKEISELTQSLQAGESSGKDYTST